MLRSVGAQVFVISREKIQKRGYETLFKYMTVNNARTTIGRSVLSAPKRWQVRGPHLTSSVIMGQRYAM